MLNFTINRQDNIRWVLMISKLLIDYIQIQNLSINKTIPIRIDLPSRRPANIKKAQPVGKNNTYSVSFTCYFTKSEKNQVAINCHSGIPFRRLHQFPGLWPKACFGPAPATAAQGTSSRSPCHCRKWNNKSN